MSSPTNSCYCVVKAATSTTVYLAVFHTSSARWVFGLIIVLFFSQILCLYDSVDALDVDKVVEYIKGLQQEDGSFAGDKWGEQDLLRSVLSQETFAPQKKPKKRSE